MAEELAAQIVVAARAANQVDESRREFQVIEVGSSVVIGFNQSPSGHVRALKESKQQLEGLLKAGWRIDKMAPASAVVWSNKSFEHLDREDKDDDKTEPIVLTTSIVVLSRLPQIQLH